VHQNAHDALSDVDALIGITRLIKDKQPDLYNYLYKLRDKNEVKKLVSLDEPKPFVYTSGRYDGTYDKTTVALPVAEAEYGNVYVYDLRYDPTEWVNKTSAELAKIMNTPYKERDDNYQPLPIKKLQYNRAPAVAPLGVLEQGDGWGRIALNAQDIQRNSKLIAANPEFIQRASELLSKKAEYPELPDAENKLYDGFIGNRDKLRMEAVRNATADELLRLEPKFDDPRLIAMLPRYKAYNFPRSLSDNDRLAYEQYRALRLTRQSSQFMRDLQTLASKQDLSDHQQFVLEELKLWYESVIPVEESYE
jgi:exodeoxyribonuclease-1